MKIPWEAETLADDIYKAVLAIHGVVWVVVGVNELGLGDLLGAIYRVYGKNSSISLLGSVCKDIG